MVLMICCLCLCLWKAASHLAVMSCQEGDGGTLASSTTSTANPGQHNAAQHGTMQECEKLLLCLHQHYHLTTDTDCLVLRYFTHPRLT